MMGEVHALAVLGAGGFGQVLLVRYRSQHYALKCIAKDFVIQQGLVAHIRREKVSLWGTQQGVCA
jgi:cGMP-dependent protein kinase